MYRTTEFPTPQTPGVIIFVGLREKSNFFFAFKRGGGITFQEDIHPCIKYWRLHQDYEKLSNIHLRRMNKVEDKVEQRKILKCGLIRRIKEGTRLNSD